MHLTHDPGKEKRVRLPGVNYSDNQLFFLNYAQIWCGHMNDQEAMRKLRTSEHSPGSIRYGDVAV
jgi:membrane metallo-endopeptidase-like protein 1